MVLFRFYMNEGTATNRLLRILVALLPGIFLIGHNIGTGGLTAMSNLIGSTQ